ncbi:hypothetical protein [Yoonia sediminilitoris]|uniref:Uncharacterized protein n=1 Tax=Yoonia sediminilitoris TaxID=1286148 RepID=A0A2T6KEZ3_9RHOB|nr:hypothetical protein [Yoonia sediminilitoris]PUB13688.1 hypothetical protein C8N45_107148 [Yoonia sediminilitoris]RCW94858.1 hypothetical protein DFP92_107148 [Yoonia sediminilitoris]
MIRHGFAILLLTALTQVGGIAWLLALLTRSFGRFFVLFLAFYTALSVGAHFAAPMAGRTALPCLDAGPTQVAVLNPLYCALNRNYVTSAMKTHADAVASHMHEQFPGTRTRALDASFPLLDGFPLLPHLTHDDGQKLDLALYWDDAAGTYQLARAKSIIGYWGFAVPRAGETQSCADETGLSLRWDLDWLQPYLRDWTLNEARTGAALRWLANNPTGTDYKLFIEPYLAKRLGVQSEHVRFQGCKAARHDDHIHVEFRP